MSTTITAPPDGALSASLSDDARLLETILFTPDGGVFLADDHLERLGAAAATLDFACPAAAALRRSLDDATEGAGPSRLRLLLRRDGTVDVESTALPPDTVAPPLSLAASLTPGSMEARLVVIDSVPQARTDVRLRFKSTDRAPYDEARARVSAGAADGRIFDVLLFNAEHECTECAIANIAVEADDGVWVTPPLECGLLDGVFRAALLRSGAVRERVVRLADVADGSRRVVAFNSVRGVFPVRLVTAAAWS
eukprot:2303605-Prymnesium_polylepis.1